jgi:hypothetical protein
MARGFESKQVESQQEEAARPKVFGQVVSPEEVERIDRRRTLELSPARLNADLQRATVPAHRKMLQQALAAIDQQLLELAASH